MTNPWYIFTHDADEGRGPFWSAYCDICDADVGSSLDRADAERSGLFHAVDVHAHGSTATGRWVDEHGAEYMVPDAVLALVREGLAVDDSWHNDSCPRFRNTRRGVSLWVDHPVDFLRETQGPRFLVMMDDDDHTSDSAVWTDELSEAVAAFRLFVS